MQLFDTSDFPARWHCGNWSAFLGWLHIVSDVAIWGAYFGIPVALIYFARKRQDFILPKVVYLFAAFIVCCGMTHLIDAIIFWHPIYRVSGLAKFATAIVSWATLGVIVKHLPMVLHLPSLAATNRRLEEEITHRARSEQELLAANARHKALLEGTRSIVWTTDAEGKFVTHQPSWGRYTGQSWEQLKDFGWLDVIHENDRPELLRKWNHAVATKTKYQSTGRIWIGEQKAWHEFVAEAVPVVASDGSICEWVGTTSDIEDQRQAELSLGIAQTEIAKQKRELELIYESAPVGMSLLDREYRFLRVNETLARFNGFTREQHIGRRASELLVDLDDQIKPIYEKVFETGKPLTDVEIVGTTAASKEQRTWLASYYPLKYDETSGGSCSASVVAVSSIVQDITARKQQEERLRESEQAALAASQSKSEFLANMSHEIRTPMAAILGYADVLLGHLTDPDNRNCVIVMKRNGQFLLELINDILDLSRIEAGRMDVEIEPCDLVQLVSDIDSMMYVRASEKKVELRAEFSTPVPLMIKTDAIRLRQVLINLVGNAIKFTEKGSVVLNVGIINGQLQFAVCDTGIGMTHEQQDRLFKPFSQGDSSVTRQFGGSGLGLVISRRLTEMLGGRIFVESEAGKGSTFRVTLPIESLEGVDLVQPKIEYKPASEETAGPPQRLHCRVLVVDDRRDVRHVSQHFLEKAGASVVTGEDGRQGIDLALVARDSGKPFDLIVMDMQMPNVDGLQATAELRSAGIESPIIALTADAMKGDREKCLNGGCDDYLSKPIDHLALVNMVARYTQDMTLAEIQVVRRDRSASLRARLSGDRSN